jgi:hypothetical protein
MSMLSSSSSILVCSTHTLNWRSRNAVTLSGSRNVLLRNIEQRLTITFLSSEHIQFTRTYHTANPLGGLWVLWKCMKCKFFKSSIPLISVKKWQKKLCKDSNAYTSWMLLGSNSRCCTVVYSSITEIGVGKLAIYIFFLMLVRFWIWLVCCTKKVVLGTNAM